MKNFLMTIIFLLIPVAGFAQQTHTETRTPEQYLKRSKVQKVLGTVVLTTGAASTILGTALIIEDNRERDEFLDGIGREAGTGFVIAGILVAGSSYFLYKASKKNRAKYEGLKPAVGIINNPATRQSTSTVGIAVNF